MSKESNTKSFKRSDYITERKSSGKNRREKKSSNRKRGNGKGTVERTKNKQNPYKAKVPVEVYIDKKENYR